MVDVNIEEFKEDSWVAAVATGISYAVLLGIMTAILFGVPYVIFRLIVGTV